MWRLVSNAICESLSTRAYANCTPELQVSFAWEWREREVSLGVHVRGWEGDQGIGWKDNRIQLDVSVDMLFNLILSLLCCLEALRP